MPRGVIASPYVARGLGGSLRPAQV